MLTLPKEVPVVDLVERSPPERLRLLALAAPVLIARLDAALLSLWWS